MLGFDVHKDGIVSTFEKQVDEGFSAAKAANRQLRDAIWEERSIKYNASVPRLNRDAETALQNEEGRCRCPGLRRECDWIESRCFIRASFQAAEQLG